MVEKQPLLNLQPSDVTEITLENGNGAWSLKRDPTAIPKGTPILSGYETKERRRTPSRQKR